MERAGIEFCSLQESINTTTPGGKLGSTSSCAGGVRAEPDPGADEVGPGRGAGREEGWPSEGGGSSARVSLTGTSSVAFSRSMTCPLTAPSSGIDGTPLLVWAVLMVEDNRDSPHREVVGDRLITRHLPNGESGHRAPGPGESGWSPVDPAMRRRSLPRGRHPTRPGDRIRPRSPRPPSSARGRITPAPCRGTTAVAWGHEAPSPRGPNPWPCASSCSHPGGGSSPIASAWVISSPWDGLPRRPAGRRRPCRSADRQRPLRLGYTAANRRDRPASARLCPARPYRLDGRPPRLRGDGPRPEGRLPVPLHRLRGVYPSYAAEAILATARPSTSSSGARERPR